MWPEELDPVDLLWLMQGYQRRKAWEFEQQAVAVVNALARATSKGEDTTSPHSAPPNNTGASSSKVVRGESGKMARQVSPKAILANIETL